MHIYEVNGKKVPSVTTIIHSIGDDNIIKWANYLGFRHINYEKELDKYATNGTLIHDLLREEVDPNYKSDVKFKDSLHRMECLGYITRFRNYMQGYTYETIFTEKTFISESHGYGGTIDWYAKFIDKFNLILDFKTSKEVRFSHLLQLGGYSTLLKENNLEVNGAAIILCNKNRTTMYPINTTSLAWYADAFESLAIYYNKVWQESMKPDTELLNSLKSTKS